MLCGQFMNKTIIVCLLSSVLISGQLWASSLQTSSSVNHSTPKTMIQTVDSTLIESFNINPYGKLDDVNRTKQPEARTMNFDQNPFIYGSGYYDTESNLQYMGARYYSADIGRFMAQDSYDLINRYNYANANPIMFIDPDGHMAAEISYGLNIAGFIAGVASAIFSGGSSYALWSSIIGAVSAAAGVGGQVASDYGDNDFSENMNTASWSLGIFSVGIGAKSIIYNVVNRSSNYIEGGYKVKQTLGSGKFGDVFEAARYGKYYAIKILNGKKAFGQANNLFNEAENWNRVQKSLGNSNLATAKAMNKKVNIYMRLNESENILLLTGKNDIMVMPKIEGQTLENMSYKQSEYAEAEKQFNTLFERTHPSGKKSSHSFLLPDIHTNNVIFDTKINKIIPIDFGIISDRVINI